MTLISGYGFKGGAFLQADVLLTGDAVHNFPRIDIPTIREVDSIPFKNTKVAGLTQKIFIIEDKLAVACAGNLSVIKSAVQLIKSYLLQRNSVPLDEIFNELNVFLSNELNEISLIFINVHNEALELGHVNSLEKRNDEELLLYIAGTGSSQAQEEFSKMANGFFDVGIEDVAVHGICTSLYHFANYMLKEFDNQEFCENLQDYFGGGFEIAAFYNGKIQKVSNILYVYSEACLDENSILQVEPPSFLVKSNYIGSDLVFSSASIYVDEESKHHKVRDEKTCTVPPLDSCKETCSERQIDPTVFIYAEYVCYFVRLKISDKRYKIFPFVKKYEDENDFIKNGFNFIVLNGYLWTNFSAEFKKEISEFAMKYLEY